MANKFKLLARAGYVARGVVYLLLGVIALTSVFWGGGTEPSSKGALSSLLGQPFGRVLLGIIAVGLIGHVLWRLAQSILNADKKNGDAAGYAARAGHLISAATNGVLAVFAARLAIGAGGSGSGAQGEDSLAAWLMQQPFGRWLVGAVGLAIIGAGCVQVWRGATAKYRKRVILPPAHEAFLHPVCAFGLSARGVLLAVSGLFFIFAALTVNAERAGSLPEALDWVHQLPFGTVLYGLAALGLVAFGAYSLVEARYRKLHTPNPPL